MTRWLGPLGLATLVACAPVPGVPPPEPVPQVIQSLFGGFVRQADGSVQLYETTNVPLQRGRSAASG